MRLLTPKDLGTLVREARTGNRMTQAQLGEKIGASRFWVAEFERGKSGAELGLALKAIRALKLVLTVESEDATSRRKQAGTSTEQHTSQPHSHPVINLASILKRSAKPNVGSTQRDPFRMYSWDSSPDTAQAAPAERNARSPKKRKRGQ
jgi:DNA-binding XRE family transcriptional regulator